MPAALPHLVIDAPASASPGRHFTRPDRDPFDEVQWATRDAVIRDKHGRDVFRQEAVEVPAAWSQSATDVVASKYFRGVPGSPERERSVRQLIERVVATIAGWGSADGYFASGAEEGAFSAELSWLLVQQAASFNSPVWFNVGIEDRPQCSACFINSVEDRLESILDLAKTEGMLFKFGSGSGSNLSALRSAGEPLSNGGTSSGPLSFMRGLDAFAGAIKSGGKTRRAARMVLLDATHPDILEFVRAKQVEERKARALVAAGYDPGFATAGGAYDSVSFQNANHSVRLPDALLRAVEADGEWDTRTVLAGRPAARLRARELLRAIAEAAWACGDPGVQYSDTVARWHTCPESGPIRASNPCSEFVFLDDTACNLASLNLLRFRHPTDGFDAAGFAHACAVLVTAQDILVDRAHYPSSRIGEQSRRFRPLGLGFANLGGLLMACGLPYDSEEGRALAAGLTALMTGAAYAQSARWAAARGAFDGYRENAAAMAAVLARHRSAAAALHPRGRMAEQVHAAATAAWDEAVALGQEHGWRNAQVTCLAPTGTIAFMMDCATTGVEPELALVKERQLVGGGRVRSINPTISLALASLGYEPATARQIAAWVERTGCAAGAPGLLPQHLAVFDCSLATEPGGRSIAASGHLLMLAALQPLLSGAISKTINLPGEATVEDVERLLLDAWRLGCKAVTVYRDGCKQSQPLNVLKASPTSAPVAIASSARRRLPDERASVTHKFSIQGHEGYLTVGLYTDGQPGELFLVMAKEGSTVSGLMDAIATTTSIALQHGVPLATLVEKLSHTRFEPSGMTRTREIPFATSPTDYIFRWLGTRFLSATQREEMGLGQRREEPTEPPGRPDGRRLPTLDAPTCNACGALMSRSGTCHRCDNCGATSGCG
jgi:ribonucleoside-diphosphate reductase alpha chain